MRRYEELSYGRRRSGEFPPFWAPPCAIPQPSPGHWPCCRKPPGTALGKPWQGRFGVLRISVPALARRGRHTLGGGGEGTHLPLAVPLRRWP